MKSITLKSGREKSLSRRHPWVFSGAIHHADGGLQPGETVSVRDAHGKALGTGAWSPRSQIAVRVWSFDPAEEINAAFFHDRIHRAVRLRETLFPASPHTARRLIHAESDGLPGIIADQYGEFVVCQFLSAGAEK